MPATVAVEKVVPPEVAKAALTTSSKRFLPLDAFRGLIMVMLVSDGLGLGAWDRPWPINHPIFHLIGQQFEHVDWIGTHFWDLIAPAFLFMVGMSMSYSVGSRAEEGVSFRQNLRAHGDALPSAHGPEPDHYLDRRKPPALSDAQYPHAHRGSLFSLFSDHATGLQVAGGRGGGTAGDPHRPVLSVPGAGWPFTKTGNIAAVMDRAIMGYNYASWTTNFNVITTSVTALFGVWAGNLLRSSLPRPRQMKILASPCW